jgi:hypothetical protein
MRKIIFFLIVFLCIAVQLYAAQSTIKIAEGTACLGDDKTRKQTETMAMSDAKRIAIESVQTFVSTSTEVQDFELKKDLVIAYTNARVEVIEELGKGWYKDPGQGDCYKVKIKADVIPDEKAMKKVNDIALDDPTLPLTVKVWSDKAAYSEGEKMKMPGIKKFSYCPILTGRRITFRAVCFMKSRPGRINLNWKLTRPLARKTL